MKTNYIDRSSCKFKMGINKPEQLLRVLEDLAGTKGVVMAGRSNVGKSSLINKLFANNLAKTSKTPGRTQQINIFTFQMQGSDEIYYLYDLPGYGFAKVSRDMSKLWQELMNTFFAYFSIRNLIVNIQDARHPDQNSDKEFSKYLQNFDNETFLALNKVDKLKKQKDRAELKKAKKKILGDYKWVTQIYEVSAESGQGVEPLEAAIYSFLMR